MSLGPTRAATANLDSPDPRLGTVLAGRWRLERILGSGGMATVYGATHRNGSRVAIKVLHERDPELVVRFIKEGYLGNRVDHPGVVRTLDDGLTDDGFAFLVMDLLEGETVNERLDRGGPLAPREAVRIAADVLEVLAAAHACDVVHRDVKPANVFLTRAGTVKLLDFGIARELRRGRQASETLAGVVLGTPAFMSPEQACGRPDQVDARTDLWATAALLFAALTDSDLRFGNTSGERLAAAMLPTPPVRCLADTIPVALADVLDRALAYEPAARFASAEEMRDALRAAMACTAESVRPVASPPKREAPAKVAGVWSRTLGRTPTRAELAGAALACASVAAVLLGIAWSVDGAPSASSPSFLPPVPAVPASTSVPHVEMPPQAPVAIVPLPVVPPASAAPVPSAVRASARAPEGRSLPVSTTAPRGNGSSVPSRSVDPMAGRF